MLAVRQHLSDCPDCKSEFEATLQIKRAFGHLDSKTPRAALAAQISARVEAQSSHRRLSFWGLFQANPVGTGGRLKLVGLAASVAILGMVLSHTADSPDAYTYSPLSPTVAVSPFDSHDATHLFSIPGGMHPASFGESRQTGSPRNQWAAFDSNTYSMGTHNSMAFWATGQ